MMKKLILSLIVFGFSFNAFGQARGIKKLLDRIRYSNYNYGADKPMFRQNEDLKDFNFGYYLGAYQMNYDLNYKNTLPRNSVAGFNPSYEVKEIIFQPQTGFGVGFITELRLSDHVDLRFEPGYLYGRTNIDFNSIKVNFNSIGDETLELKQSMLYLPFLIKLSSTRYDNFRPFVVAGISKSVRLGAKNDEVRRNIIDLRSNVNQLEVGLGVDLYLPYFKFTPAIRAIYGRENELLIDKNDISHWSNTIVDIARRRGLKNRAIFFVLTFE